MVFMVHRPANLNKVNEFLEENKTFRTEGERLLNRLTMR